MELCDLCQTPRPFERLFRKGAYELRRCLACGLIYCSPMPSQAESASLYSEDFYGSSDGRLYGGYLADEETLVLNFRRQLERIEAYKAPPGRLLDVGCAAGFFLKAASSRWRVLGLDISPYVVRHAREELGLEVIEGDVFGADLPPQSFDVVTLWDTIEHVRDPYQAFTIIHRLLDEDGLLAASTGDASSLLARLSLKRWRLMAPPHHLYYFTPQTIGSLLKKTGFKLLRIEKVGKWFSLNSILHSLGCHLRNHGRWPSTARLYVNLRDVITAYAVKQNHS